MLSVRGLLQAAVGQVVTGVAETRPRPSAPDLVTPAARRRGHVLRSRYLGFLGLLALVYVAIYGWLLLSTSFLPYVMDNNESFSAFWHASNIYNFGVSQTFGLTDESFSPHPEAHPYVHTHQGNFPRVFAYVIYVLGARTIEAQIAVTTFTIGVLTIFFAYHYFARVSSPLFAFILCAVLLTDYIFYAQWNVVTYRVWHAFFVFSSLLCVRGLGGRRARLWTGLTFLNYLALFYFEFVFVAFVSLLAAAHAWLRYRRERRRWLLAWGAQVAGGLAGVLVLVAQLIAYLGPSGLLTDVYVTYVARNAAENPQLLQEIRQFYESHKVAFWYNFVDSSGLRNPGSFVGTFFSSSFQIFTPLLSLIVFIVVAGALLGLLHAGVPGLFGRGRVRRRVRARGDQAAVGWQGALVWDSRLLKLRLAGSVEVPPDSWLRRGWRGSTGVAWSSSGLFRLADPPGWLARIVPLFLSLHVLLVVILRDHAFEGVPATARGLVLSTGGFGTLAAALSALAICAALTQMAGGRARFAHLRWTRVLAACVLSMAAAYFIDHQAVLYQQPFSIVWLDQLEGRVPDAIGRAAVAAAGALATALVLLGSPRLLGRRAARDLRAIATYLVCATLAYTGAYLLVPGYVYSGYLIRSAPLTVFLSDVLIAACAYVCVAWTTRTIRLARRGRSGLLSASRPALSPHARGNVAGLLLAGTLCLFLTGFWGVLQRSYMQLLPPDHFEFLKMLSQPPYLHASFVVNQYSAPVAAYADQWAYFDPLISSGRVTLTSQGYDVERDLDTYLWLADRRDNPAYLRPDYYVCMIAQSLDTVVYRLDPRLGIGANSRCTSLGLVGLASGAREEAVHPQLMAIDQPERDYWAIVKLDWDYPPYLQPLSGPAPDARVRLGVSAEPDGSLITNVEYAYAQQDGKPEEGSVVRLYRVLGNGSRCVLQEAQGTSSLRLPAGFNGQVQASVTPRTATRSGEEFFSRVVQVGQPDGAAAAGCE